MSLESKLTLLAQAVGTDVKTLTNAIGVLANLSTTAKTNLVLAVNELYTANAANSTSIGTLASLTTSAQGNLVAAINELDALIAAIDLTSIIDDLALSSVADKTYSANKITTLIAAAVTALIDASPGTLDTLNELAAALGDDPNFAATITTALGNRVRVDAVQTFTAPQQTQARDNIGAASSATVSALSSAVGNTERDLVADYTAAKA